jgi:hypothetical protein
MKLNDHINEIINTPQQNKTLQKKTKLINSKPMIDIIFNAIVKVDKKNQNYDNKILLIKRYLRKCYNIDVDSNVIKSRITNLTKQKNYDNSN